MSEQQSDYFTDQLVRFPYYGPPGTTATSAGVALVAAPDTREALAAYAHDAWTGWMVYLYQKSTINEAGQVIIPAELSKRWLRQMNTAYADLPEDEKDSDRAEADKMLALVTR